MAAEVGIYVYTGADAGSESSGSVVGIDLCSADTDLNTATNRQDYPITAGSKSYEKWVKAKLITAPDNYCENFELWWDGGAVQESTGLWVGTNTVDGSAGSTPTSEDSGVANNSWEDYPSGGKFGWFSGSITSTGSTTDYAVFQLDVDAAAAAGNWTQETLNYSYDEA